MGSRRGGWDNGKGHAARARLTKLAAPANGVANSRNRFILTVTAAMVPSRLGLVRSHMPFEVKIRRFSGVVCDALFAIAALLAGTLVPPSAVAQTGEPVKIGYGMA